MAEKKQKFTMKGIGGLPVFTIDVEIHKQRELCRVEIENGKFGGYKKDILTENLTDRDTALLVCSICEGIMREACISSSGEQFCSCCEVLDPNPSKIHAKTKMSGTKQTKLRNTLSKQAPNISVRNMIRSLKCACPLSERGCQWLGTLMECEDHLDQCGYVRNMCTLGCGAVLQCNELSVHEEEMCPKSTVMCKHCKRELKRDVLHTHHGMCPKLKLPCEMKCGETIPRQDMTQHLRQECCLVIEICELGCGMEFTRSELRIHVSDTCVQRLVPCKHCSVDIKFCEKRHHLSTCPRWRIPCDLKCGKTIPRQDMAQHLNNECCMVVETCELGCGIQLTRKTLKEHQTDTCEQRKIQCEYCNGDIMFCRMYTHLYLCPKMEVSCDLACGEVLCREDMTQHLEMDCPEKEIECPFAKYDCEVGPIKRKDLENHLEMKETEHMEMKLDFVERICIINVNRLSAQIDMLCSFNNTTKLDWEIGDITEFIETLNRPPEQKQVGEYILNIYFHAQRIYASFEDKLGTHQTTIVANFLICLYSNSKMTILKQYKHDVSKFMTGNVKQEISHISDSDIQEFFHIGGAESTILYMYVTIM